MQRYQITLKPYQDELVNQPLDITQEMELTDEQVHALSHIFRNLVKDFDKNPIIDIKRWDGEKWVDYVRKLNVSQTHMPFSDHPRSNNRGERKRGITWDRYLSFNNVRPTKRYVMIFPSYIYANLIYQFDTPEFLQGLITAANWLGVDWHEWILDLHDANTGRELEIVE